MAETLTSTDHSSVDLESLQSRLKSISEPPVSPSIPDPGSFLQDWTADFKERMEEIEPDVSKLGFDVLEAYLEELRREVRLTEDESSKLSVEIGELSRRAVEESAVLEGEMEALGSSLDFIDSQGMHLQAGKQYGRSTSEETHESPIHISEDHKFQIWDLDQQLEKSKSHLVDLQELDCVFKRVEIIGQLEDTLSAAKVTECKGNFLRLSLRTVIPILDGLLRHKLDSLKETLTLDHELLIEVVDSSMELNNVEIFPSDICLEEIVATIKSSRHLTNPVISSSLGWLVKQVQHQIYLCGLRRLLVKDASKSRHTFEYSDGDGMITAHLIGGIDAFIKISQGWPLSSSSLKLVSVKNTNAHSKSISLGFLCKVEELVNSLEVQKRRDPASFLDAIEETLIREMHSELHLDNPRKDAIEETLIREMHSELHLDNPS